MTQQKRSRLKEDKAELTLLVVLTALLATAEACLIWGIVQRF